MAYKFEKDYNKYLVLKVDDIRKLPRGLQEGIEAAMGWITAGRILEGKKNNSYVVVNEDEPYAETVWELIKKEEERKHGSSSN